MATVPAASVRYPSSYMRYAMIMAGGAGTRLWPMSRKERPKQLLDFIELAGDGRRRSLLEIAANRLDGLIDEERRYICTAESYRAMIRKQMPGFADAQILGEPAARDTVNAVGFAAAVLEKEDKDAVFAVLTADHIIEPDEVFRERMDLGFRLVENDPSRFVTFSIKPTYAATGFGYVERARRCTTRSTASTRRLRAGSRARFMWRGLWRSRIWRGRRLTWNQATSIGTRGCLCGRPRRFWRRFVASSRNAMKA